MRLVVTTRYAGEAEVGKVHVGDGRKTFKWLGLVAAQRFCQRAPRGCIRHRERAGVLLPHGSSLLPVSVWSSEQQVYHPDRLIVDHLCDGEHVTVELGRSVRVDDERLRVSLEGFAMVAFQKKSVPETERHQAWAAVQSKADRRRMEEEAVQQAERARQREARAQEMCEVLGLQQAAGPVAETWLLNAFQRVWARLSSSRALEAVLPLHQRRQWGGGDEDDDEMGRLRKLLLQHFSLLYELFCRFSAENVDSRLSLPEFVRMVHALQLPHKPGLAPDLLAHVFLDSDCSSDSSSSATVPPAASPRTPPPPLLPPVSPGLGMTTRGADAFSTVAAGTALLRGLMGGPGGGGAASPVELDLAGFLLSLVHLSLGQFVDPLLVARLPHVSLMEVRRRRHVLATLHPKEDAAPPLPSLTEALSRLISEYVGAFAKEQLLDVLIKQTAASTEVLASLAHYHHQLQRVFARWAGKARMGGFGRLGMSFFSFRELAVHCGLASEQAPASIRALKSAFIACKRDDAAPQATASSSKTHRSPTAAGKDHAAPQRRYQARRVQHHPSGDDDGSSSGGGGSVGSSSSHKGGRQVQRPPQQTQQPQQHEGEEDEAWDVDDGGDYTEGVSVSYPEFVEAVVRMGVHHFSDLRVPLAEKMLHTVHLVVGGVEKH